MDTRNIWNETMAWLAAERLHWAALRAGGACALNQGRLGRSFCGVKIAGAYWPGRPHPCQPIPAVSFISLSLPGCGHHCPAGYVPLQPAAHHSPLSTPHYPATIIANRHLTSPRLASPRLAQRLLRRAQPPSHKLRGTAPRDPAHSTLPPSSSPEPKAAQQRPPCNRCLEHGRRRHTTPSALCPHQPK
jgi:hypothetical protein